MRGFTLIEAMMALLLLSFAAAALGESFLAAQRAQVEGGRWMRAAALAEEALERARLHGGSGADTVGSFSRSWTTSPGDGVRRLEVVVAWQAPSPRHLRLVTLVRP
jgi:prepilin-type N-terminal cleavage/methylation domain-containing protein